MVGDVSTFEGAANVVAQCPFVVSAVFCCAGGAKPGYFLEQNEADFQQGMKLDYWTALATAHVRASADTGCGSFDEAARCTWKDCVCEQRPRLYGNGWLCAILAYEVCHPRYVPEKSHLTGLAECLRMELQLYGIQVHSYFPATILSPGFEEENKTKPSLTKEIEGTDEGQTPEQCAMHLLQGIDQNYFSVTDCLIGSFMRIASGGCAPGQSWFTDSFLLLPARVRVKWLIIQWALVAWRRFVADRAVQKVSVSSVY